MRRVAGFAWDHPALSTAILAVAVLVAMAGARQVRIDLSSTSFYASDDEAAAALMSFHDRWGPDDNVVMVVAAASDGDLLTEDRIAAIGRLGDALAGVDGVRAVTSIASIRFRPPDQPDAVARPLWALPAFDATGPITREDVLSRLPFVPLLLSTDARTTAVAVELDATSDDPAVVMPVVTRIESVVVSFDEPGLVMRGLAGVPAIRASFVHLVVRDQFILVPASMLVIALALFWIFRRAHGVLIPGAAAILPLVLLVGVMGWAGEPIGLLNQAYFTLIPVLALADAVHVLSRYHEERQTLDARDAVRAAARHAGLACALTTATTIVAFVSLGIGSPPILVRFGVYASVGLALAFATVFVVVPVGLRLTHALPPPAGRQGWLIAMSRLATRRPIVVVALAALVAVLSALSARHVAVDNRLSGLLRADHPVRQTGSLVDSVLGGTHAIEVDLEGEAGAFAQQAVVNAAATFEDWAAGLPGVRAVIGPGRSLESMAQASGAVLDSPDAIDATWARLAAELDTGRLVSTERDRSRVTIRVVEIGGTAIDALATRIRDEAVLSFTPLGVRATVTGTSLVASRGVNRIGEAIQSSLLLQFGAIAVMFGVLFGSVRIALIALVPNVLPILAGYGLLGWLGLDLDPLAGTILAFGVGIAVDDTIHVLVRIRERQRAGDDLQTAIETAVARSGRAVAITTLVIGAGLALNMLSSFPPLALLGLLGAVLMLTALVSDLVLLPALLVLGTKADVRQQRPPAGRH